MSLGASNVSFGMPDRHAIGAAFLPMAIAQRADQRDHGRPVAADRPRGAGPPTCCSDRDAWGAAWIAAHRARQASGRRPQARDAAEQRPAGTPTLAGCDTGPVRVDLRFEPSGARSACRAGSPCSTPRAGTASRSTRPAAATARARSARSGSRRSAAAADRLDARAFTPDELRGRLAAGLPGPGRRRRRRRGAAAGHPAEGGDGRRRPPGDPAPGGAEAPPGARRAVAGRPAHRPAAGAGRARRPGAARRPGTCCATLGRALRAADFDVTAVVVDDELIDVEPGDTTRAAFGIAFDLGTTTVVATLLDLTTGTPLAVRSMLNRQQPFGADVITRICATMMDPAALATLRQLAHETLAELAAEVCEAGRGRPGRGLRDRGGGQRDDDAPGARHRPRAAGVAPFIMAARLLPEVLARRPRRPAHPRARRSCSRRSAPTSAATSSPGCSPPGWTATRGSGCSSTSARTARSCSATGTGCWPPPRRPGPRSRARRSAAGCAPPTARSRGSTITPDGDLDLKVIGDAEPLGLCGSGLVDAVAELVQAGLLDHSGRFVPARRRPRSRPAWPTG